jgi:hypothetical protein
MRLLFLLLLLSCAARLHAADAWHTFTDIRGRKLEAKILRIESDHVVVELKSNGRQIPLDFENLSDEDNEFLKNHDSDVTPQPASAGGVEASDSAVPDGDPEKSRLYPKTREEIRAGIREIERRAKPEDVTREVHEATQKLNIYRFLCGVPHEVEADMGFSKNAEDAALACKKHGSLSHGIGHSTDKCNLSTVGNMTTSVSQYIEDSGANNRDARGHRAWCLNPPMGKVGFGSGGDSYSAMWCMDGSGEGIRGIWTYPGCGLFPIEYMHGNAWSLYGAGKPESADKLKVEVFRLAKRPDKPLPLHGEIDGRSIKVNHVSLGFNSAINFEPDEPNKRGVYWVRVTGGGIREGYLVELF